MGDIDTRMGLGKFGLLPLHQAAANFDDVVARTFVHVGIFLLQEIEDVHGKCAVSCTNFVDHKVFVWEVLEQVFRDKTPSDGTSIPRLPFVRKSWKSGRVDAL